MIQFISRNIDLVEQSMNTTVVDPSTRIFNGLLHAFENMSLLLERALFEATDFIEEESIKEESIKDKSIDEKIIWNPQLKQRSVHWNPKVLTRDVDGKQDITSLKKEEPPHVGELSYSNGAVYYGKHFNKIPNGWGMMTYPDHRQFMGMFKGGAPNGWGIMTYPNGAQHMGEFRDGIPINEEGLCVTDESITEKNKGSIGKTSHSDGRVYYGKHFNSIPNGWGVMTYPNGTQFIGEFKDGDPNGWGIATYPNGAQHTGEYRNGRQIDEDPLSATDGPNVKKNKWHVGEWIHPDGRVYYGKHFNGIPNGWGKITYPNNTQFIGEFEHGTSNGWGMCCTPDGQIIAEGRWDNGIKVL